MVLAPASAGVAYNFVMDDIPLPVGGFLDAIKGWIDTVEQQRPDHARIESEKLNIFGRLLSEDGEFKELFRHNLDHCSEQNPEHAIKCVYAFFNTVAETTRPNRFRAKSGGWQERQLPSS